jgi:hypothetical protein
MVVKRTNGPSYGHAVDKLVILAQFSALFALEDGREVRTCDSVEFFFVLKSISTHFRPIASVFGLILRRPCVTVATKQYQHFSY